MFAKMKTGTKVLSGFGFAIAMLVIVGVIGYVGLARVYDKGDSVAENCLPSVDALGDLGRGVLGMEVGLRGLADRQLMDPVVRKTQYDFFEENRKGAEEGVQQFGAFDQQAEEAATWKTCVMAWEKWRSLGDRVVELARAKDGLLASGTKPDDPKINEIDDRTFKAALEVSALTLDLDRQIDGLIEINTIDARSQSDDADAVMSSTRIMTVVSILVGAAILLVLGLLLARSISKVLKNLIGEATRLSVAAVEGKLQTRGNPELVSLEFRPIVDGVNATLDAVIGPLERGRRVRRSHLEGGHPGEDHRHLQRRLQRDQEQPKPVH